MRCNGQTSRSMMNFNTYIWQTDIVDSKLKWSFSFIYVHFSTCFFFAYLIKLSLGSKLLIYLAILPNSHHIHMLLCIEILGDMPSCEFQDLFFRKCFSTVFTIYILALMVLRFMFFQALLCFA